MLTIYTQTRCFPPQRLHLLPRGEEGVGVELDKGGSVLKGVW